jgi:putative nucleotidyltransferase with HDIG domain
MTASMPRSASSPSSALRPYVQVVVAVGGLVLVQAGAAAVHTAEPLEWCLFAALAIVTGSFKLNFASVSASISVGDTFFITSALLFGPGPATVAIAADSFVISWRRRNPWPQVAFNSVAPAVSLWLGAQTFFLIARVPPLAHSDIRIGSLVVPLLALTTIYFTVNSGLTAVAIGLESRHAPFEIWRRHFLWLSISYLASASIAFCLIVLIQQVGFGAAAMILPLLVVVFYLTLRSSFGRLEDAPQHLSDMDRLYLSTVETLAMAIDAKDDVTHNHLRRVRAYAIGLARALGVTDEPTLKAIEAGALLHDAGKLAVPEHILNKPGKLTAPEFEKMKRHVDIGADILSLVHFPYPVVPIVRCHHENWDGSGYPRGIAGVNIPLGARILSVVDCFDAVTSDRPYHRRLPPEAAIAILHERRGRMYDPHVVDTFVRIYPQLAAHAGDESTEPEDPLPGAGSWPEPSGSSGSPPLAAAAPHGLLAFVSLTRMANGDGSARDVLALSSNLIADIVPGTTGAWYLPDTVRDRLVVAEAFGPGAHGLAGMTISIGERLTGWVATTHQSIANADAALDLGARADTVTPRLESCLSVPLMMGDVLVGVLSLYGQTVDAFDEQHSRLIEIVAPHIAGAIHAAARMPAAMRDPAAAPAPHRLRTAAVAVN